MKLNNFTKKDLCISLSISLFLFLFIFFTGYLIGLVRDEGFYIRAAEISSDWIDFSVKSVAKGEFTKPFSRETITKYYEYNHEHPTFVKNMFGLSHYLFYKKLHILSYVGSVRIVAAFFAGLIVFLMYLMGAIFFNRLTAICAPFLFFAMPHVFFHSHLACFDVPVMAFWFGTMLLFAIAVVKKSHKWAVLSAVFLGLGIASKHNMFFVPLLFVAGWIFSYIVSYSNLEKEEKGFKGFFLAIPAPFWYFVTVSIPLYFLCWPWLWYDTVERFKWYYYFHAKHVNYTNYYFGKEITDAPFPISFPCVMSFFTTPTPILIMFFAGALVLFLGFFKNIKNYRVSQVYIAFLSAVFFPIILISLPSVPIFGGIKHWFTGYPLLVVAGLYGFFEGMSYLFRNYSVLRQNLIKSAAVVIILLSLIPANIKFAKHGAAYFNELIGGAQGAASLQMQRNFWGYDILPLVETLNKTAGKGARVFIMSWNEGLNGYSFEALKKQGVIRSDLIGTNELKEADFAFFFYEKQNEFVLYDIYNEFGTSKPLAMSEADSVLYSALFRRIK